jgi:hypothetical protein
VDAQLNSQTASFQCIPKYIQEILSSPNKFHGAIVPSAEQVIETFCEIMTTAINEYELSIEETIFVFKSRLRKE